MRDGIFFALQTTDYLQMSSLPEKILQSETECSKVVGLRKKKKALLFINDTRSENVIEVILFNSHKTHNTFRIKPNRFLLYENSFQVVQKAA